MSFRPPLLSIRIGSCVSFRPNAVDIVELILVVPGVVPAAILDFFGNEFGWPTDVESVLPELSELPHGLSAKRRRNNGHIRGILVTRTAIVASATYQLR